MDARALARAMAIGRVAFGTTFLLTPGNARGWIGADAGRPGARVFITGLGGRDLAIGAGLLSALGRGGVKPWLLAGIVSDAADVLGTLRSRDDIPTVGAVVGTAIAGGSVALGAWMATQEDW